MQHIATIGFFDGVHKGHRYLIDQLNRIAQQRGLQPLVVTFRQHPREVLQSDYIPQLLTSLDERMALLRQQTSNILLMDFAEIQHLTASEFMHVLRFEHGVTTLLMGYDHQFGSDRLRHAYDYKNAGQQEDIEVITLSEFTDGELHVSSTEIRQSLEHGNIMVANELLGRQYTLSGIVVHGNGIGRTMGFPTANIQPDNSYKIIPKSGVYVCRVAFNSMQKAPGGRLSYPALVNIGTNPTVGNRQQTIEAHIPDWHGDLYGQVLTLSFERFVRSEHKFDDLKSLQEQISYDLAELGSTE